MVFSLIVNEIRAQTLDYIEASFCKLGIIAVFSVITHTFFLALYEKADIKVPEDKKKHLLIGVSSDRGLCGAIHSSIAKHLKSEVANLTAAGKEVKIVGVGDKLRSILHR